MRKISQYVENIHTHSTHSLSLSHTYTLHICLSLSHTYNSHTCTHSVCLSVSLSLSHSHTHTHSVLHSQTHFYRYASILTPWLSPILRFHKLWFGISDRKLLSEKTEYVIERVSILWNKSCCKMIINCFKSSSGVLRQFRSSKSTVF